MSDLKMELPFERDSQTHKTTWSTNMKLHDPCVNQYINHQTGNDDALYTM